MPGSQLLRLVLATLLVAIGFSHAQAQPLEKRIALVIGNGAYQAGTLASPANDAGLVAQTLQAAGFDVVGARDLDMATFRASLREFIDKANASGPDTVAFVYFAGYGLQFEGENYLVPVDARIARDSDVPLEAIRLSDLVRPLAGLPLKARIVVLDAARQNGFARAGQPLAGGLALAQPDAGMLLAFNAAPGTIAPEANAGYGAYATALSEMIKEGGLKLDDLFERVRLRVDGLTQGAELAWHVSRVEAPFLFFERAQGAPVEAERFSELRSRPIREFDPRQAYLAAVARDSMRGYQDFLAAYPDDPLARRVRAIVAARREATTWRESALADTREGYWSYLRRYPRGPHAYDARRRLAHLAAELEPPAAFAMLSYDVPPPPPEEVVYIERPVVYLADPVYELPPPPPVPVIYLPPRPAYFVELPPPPPPVEAYVLPVPVYHPVASWVERPRYVAPPPENVVNVNIHNTVVIDQSRQTVVVTNPAGEQLPPASAGLPDVPQPAPGQPALSPSHLGMAAAAAAAVAALPAAAALRAASQRPKPNGLQGVPAPASGPSQAQPVRPPQVPGQPPMQAPPTQQARPQQQLPGNAVQGLRPGQPPVQGAQPLPPQPNQPGLANGDKNHAAPTTLGATKPSPAAPGAPPAGANGPASAARPVQPSTPGAQPLPQPNQPGLATGGKGHAAPPAPGAAKPSLAAPGAPPAGANGPGSAARPAQPLPQNAQPLPQPHQPGPADNGKGSAAAAPSTPSRAPGAVDAAQQQRAQQAAQQQRAQQQAAQAARDQQMRAQQQAAAQQRQAQQAAQQQRAQQQAQQAARDQQMRAQQQAAVQQRQAQQAAQQQRAQQQAAQAAREQQMRAQQQAAQQHQMMQMQQQRAQQQAAQQQQRAAQAAAQQRQMVQQRQAAPHPQGGPHGPRRPDCGNPGQQPCR